LDDEEKIIKSKAEAFNKLLQTDENRLTEEGSMIILFDRIIKTSFL
jgi:hypothetical protein